MGTLNNLISKWTQKIIITGNEMDLVGKSTDTKPTSNIPKGATFYETDTKDVYIWDGSTWVVM